MKTRRNKKLLAMLRSVGTLKDDCAIKIKEMFIFLPLISISVTIALAFLLLSNKTINYD